MNKARFNKLYDVTDRLRALKGAELSADDKESELDDIVGIVEDLRDAEQDAYDNLPESLQYTERAEQWQENVDTYDEALGMLYDAQGDVMGEGADDLLIEVAELLDGSIQ